MRSCTLFAAQWPDADAAWDCCRPQDAAAPYDPRQDAYSTKAIMGMFQVWDMMQPSFF